MRRDPQGEVLASLRRVPPGRGATFPFLMNTKTLTAALAAGLLVAPTQAQIGDPMPNAEFAAFGNTEATQLDDFKGRLILLEVFAYW